MVVLMRESGFCSGVRNAVDKALQYDCVANQEPVVLFGNLVNNKHVMQKFMEKGYVITEDIDSIPNNSTVIIRAHGVPKIVYDELKRKEVNIEDSTCVNVQKIHSIVEQKSSDGYKIVIIGKRNHPEVIGTYGWCGSGEAFIVESELELNNLDISGRVCIVAQTTFNKNLWERITAKILERNPSSEICNTLCNVTKRREDIATEMAQSVDAVVVIGDNNSSNTCELFRKCSICCENTILVSSLSDLLGNGVLINKILQGTKFGVVGSASASDDKIAEIYNYLVFTDLLKSAKQEIENFSHEYLEKYSVNVKSRPFVQASLKELYTQNEGGKRIRGALIKLGEQIASHGTSNNYLPVAIGYELFQTSILIHDDIIDRSDKRRGKKTIHAKLAENLQNLYKDLAEKDIEHFSMSQALCIGDYGFFISYQMLAGCNVDTATLVQLYQMYSQIFAITCEGEIMDTNLPMTHVSAVNNNDEYEDMVLKMYEYKTAWYTLAGPLMLGAICGGADESLLSLIKSIAIPLGIAFQIRDDLLGIYSSEAVLGKSVLSDIRENKQTLLLGAAYKNANEKQRQLLNIHYGKVTANEEDLKIVQELFEETGAKVYAEDEINRLLAVGKEKIANIEKEYQPALYGLAGYLVDRAF